MVDRPTEAAARAEALSAALAVLERALHSPIVAGELPAWIREAAEACGHVGAVLAPRLHLDYPALLKEIARQDPELMPHVTRLNEEGLAIEDDYSGLQRALEQFAQVAGNVEPREEKFSDHVQQLVQQGLELVLRVRKQETALETWLLEAFLRDRGVAD